MIIYRGRKYQTYQELAKRYHKTVQTVKYRLDHNLPIEPKRISIGWWNNYDGKFFKNLEALANYYQLNQDQIRYRLRQGYTYKQALLSTKEFNKISNSKNESILIGNKRFKSLRHASRYYEVDKEIVRKLSKGEIKEQDLYRLKNSWNPLHRKINGKIYNSWKEVISDYPNNNLSMALLSSRYSKGLRDNDLIKPPIVTKLSGKSQDIIVGNKQFSSLTKLAAYYNINVSTLTKRYRNGDRDEYLVRKPGKFTTSIK